MITDERVHWIAERVNKHKHVSGGGAASWLDKTYQHVVYLSADGHVHELRFALGIGPWTHTDLTAAAGAPAARSGALTSWTDSKYQHVGYVSADGHVQHLYSPLGSASWANTDLKVAAGAPPALGSAGALTSWADPAYQHVVFMSGDRHVHELHNPLGTTTWQTTDLTAVTGGQT